MEGVTEVSKASVEKGCGDIVTEAEIGELKRIELSKMNLKTENRVNKNAVVVEEVNEVHEEVGEGNMKLFGKKKEENKEETTRSLTRDTTTTEADDALDAVTTNEADYIHEFVPPTETTESATEEVVEENTEIKNEEVHEEEKMNETTETTQTQQETAPAPRKRLTTKRVVVTTGIILGAATLITTGVVCWKKFHK